MTIHWNRLVSLLFSGAILSAGISGAAETPTPKAVPAEVIPLWEKGAPGFESRKDEPEVVEKGSITNIHNPSLTVFLPQKRRPTALELLSRPEAGFRNWDSNQEVWSPHNCLLKMALRPLC